MERLLLVGGRLVGRRLDIFGLETLEGGDVDVRHEGVELVHGVLVLVPQPGEPDANAEWDAPVKQGKIVSEYEGMN